MNKFLLSLMGGVMFFMATSVSAQENTYTVNVYNFANSGEEEALLELFDGTYGCALTMASANGEWAVGYAEDAERGLIWSRATGKFCQITGSLDDKCWTYGVSNDGTVCGVYRDDNNGAVASGGVGYTVPGLWKNGVWTPLELAVPKSEGDVNGEARWISGDGRIVTGYIRDYFMRDTDGNGVLKKKTPYRICVWIDGKLQPKPENAPNGDDFGQGYYTLYHSSEDGSVIVGYYEHPTGTRAPAVWVNNDMRLIYGEEDIDINLEDQYWFDGHTTSVSPNGKYAAGYFSPTGTYRDNLRFFYDIENDKHNEIAIEGDPSYMMNDRTLFYVGGVMNPDGTTTSIDGWLTQRYGSYGDGSQLPQYILSVSHDGKTLAGWYPSYFEGGAGMLPCVVSVVGGPEGINNATDNGPGVVMRYGVAMADGAEKIELFDAEGRRLASANTSAITLNGRHGTVIAKATYKNGEVKSAKFNLK
ncbi:MAG: hypothetical protein IKU63_06830 [Bacteroidaceae bacterium]|nr:hypothetical protein [Bacteroidaceae bacterium]